MIRIDRDRIILEAFATQRVAAVRDLQERIGQERIGQERIGQERIGQERIGRVSDARPARLARTGRSGGEAR